MEMPKKTLIILSLIIFILVVILSYIGLKSDKQSEKEEIINDDKIGRSDIIDYDKIKMDIISKKSDYIPGSFNVSKAEIVDEYLGECHSMNNSKEIVECLEVYYSDENSKISREQCGILIGKDHDRCLEEYYFFQARKSLEADYCKIIKDDSLKQECLNYN